MFPLLKQLNLDRLLAKMWEEMGLVRVYTKPQGQQPDFSDPVVLSAVCHISFCHTMVVLVKLIRHVEVSGIYLLVSNILFFNTSLFIGCHLRIEVAAQSKIFVTIYTGAL